MRTIYCGILLFLGVYLTQLSSAQERKDFVSDASFIVGTYRAKTSDHSEKSMAASAKKFVETLTEDQKKKTVGKVNSEVRRQWTNLPARPDADGIRLGDLNEVQVKAACDLMASLLSKQGYDKMVQIMLADDQLLRGGRPRQGFGTENFSLVVFGAPSEKEEWGFQIDGHHVGLNLSIKGESITMSPSFIGTQPSAFRIAEKFIKPFELETDLGHQLVASLDAKQLQTAIVSDRRGRMMAGPGMDGKTPKANGVKCSTFNEGQRKILRKLISQWVNDLPKAQADKRMKQLAGEIDQMTFAWSGDKGPISDMSYVLQGPSLIIEYVCQDLGGNPLDHLHSVYRDPTNEYGGQMEK